METFTVILNNYVGRDSVIRTCSYLSLLLSEYANEKLSMQLKIVSRELSYCRLINRLFDDMPMLKFALQYGLGLKEEDNLLRLLCIIQNIVDQIYLPVEHVAWAANKKFFSADKHFLNDITSGLWALSSYIGILRSLVTLAKLESNKQCIKNGLNENISGQQFEELLFAIKNSLDFIIAINYLPASSILWAGTISTKRVAFYGLISSMLRFYLYLRNMTLCT